MYLSITIISYVSKIGLSNWKFIYYQNALIKERNDVNIDMLLTSSVIVHNFIPR